MGTTNHPSRLNMPTRDTVSTSRPRLGLGEVLLYMWRSKWLMAAVFIPVFFLGLSLAYLVPVPYTVSATVRFSYSEQAPSLPDSQMEMEARKVLGRPVVTKALGHFPLARIYPDLAQACETDPGRTTDASSASCSDLVVQSVQRDAYTRVRPGSDSFEVFYQHADTGVAGEVLNALVGAYLNDRKPVETDEPLDQRSPQQASLESDLQQAERDLLNFLQTHDMAGFEFERERIGRLYQDANTDRSQASMRLSSVSSELEALRKQLQSIPQEQEVFVEDSAPARLLDLKLEREDLLTRYQPNSRRIQELDERISRLETYLGTDRGRTGITRTGPNPLYQEIEASRRLLAAQASALKANLTELDQRVETLGAELNRLQALEPEYRALERRRDVLETALRQSSVREMETASPVQHHDISNYRVEIVEGATRPVPVDDRRNIFVGIAALVAMCLSLCMGVARAFSRRRFATAGSLSRTLNLPVLAAIRQYR